MPRGNWGAGEGTGLKVGKARKQTLHCTNCTFTQLQLIYRQGLTGEEGTEGGVESEAGGKEWAVINDPRVSQCVAVHHSTKNECQA